MGLDDKLFCFLVTDFVRKTYCFQNTQLQLGRPDCNNHSVYNVAASVRLL